MSRCSVVRLPKSGTVRVQGSGNMLDRTIKALDALVLAIKKVKGL